MRWARPWTQSPQGPYDTSAQLSVNATSPVWLSALPRHCSQSLSVPWGACPHRLPPAVPSLKLPALCGLLPYQHPAGPAGACLRLAGHHPPALVSCAPQAPSLSCGSSYEGSVLANQPSSECWPGSICAQHCRRGCHPHYLSVWLRCLPVHLLAGGLPVVALVPCTAGSTQGGRWMND